MRFSSHLICPLDLYRQTEYVTHPWPRGHGVELGRPGRARPCEIRHRQHAPGSRAQIMGAPGPRVPTDRSSSVGWGPSPSGTGDGRLTTHRLSHHRAVSRLQAATEGAGTFRSLNAAPNLSRSHPERSPGLPGRSRRICSCLSSSDPIISNLKVVLCVRARLQPCRKRVSHSKNNPRGEAASEPRTHPKP
jgi:hypothetical protein